MNGRATMPSVRRHDPACGRVVCNARVHVPYLLRCGRRRPTGVAQCSSRAEGMPAAAASMGPDAGPDPSLVVDNWADLRAVYKGMVSKEAKKAAEVRLEAERKAAAAARNQAATALAKARQAREAAASKEAAAQAKQRGVGGTRAAAATPEASGTAERAARQDSQGAGAAAGQSQPLPERPPGFTGFGTPPAAAATAAANPRRFRIFRHAVDMTRVQQAIAGNDWQVSGAGRAWSLS